MTLESRQGAREPTQSVLVGVVWQKLSAMTSHRQRTLKFLLKSRRNKIRPPGGNLDPRCSMGKARQKMVCSRISVDGDLEISSSSPNLHPVEPVFFPIGG